jgi:GTP 3',8-cyclase
MIDSFKREINYLRISITDRCNLRCRYCMPEEGLSLLNHEDILRYEEILRIVRASVALGIVKVRITGGEPLVRRGILDFLKELQAVDGLQEVTLTTNGVLLGKMASQLYDTGVKRINVSLDSLNPEKYSHITRGGDLQTVLDGIRIAHEVGFSPIKINVVVMKGFNDDEIFDFAAMAALNPYQIRFIELMSLDKACMQNESYLSNESLKARLMSVYDLELVEKTVKSAGPANVYRIKGGVGQLGFIGAGSRHLCMACNRIRLTADGYLRTCLLSNKEIDIRSILRVGCSDQELIEMIVKAIGTKSETREGDSVANQIKKCSRPMSAIGG